MLAYFTLGMMIAILIALAVTSVMMKRIADISLKTGELVNDTLDKQNEIQLELIQRVGLLERRMKARAGNEGG